MGNFAKASATDFSSMTQPISAGDISGAIGEKQTALRLELETNAADRCKSDEKVRRVFASATDRSFLRKETEKKQGASFFASWAEYWKTVVSFVIVLLGSGMYIIYRIPNKSVPDGNLNNENALLPHNNIVSSSADLIKGGNFLFPEDKAELDHFLQDLKCKLDKGQYPEYESKQKLDEKVSQAILGLWDAEKKLKIFVRIGLQKKDGSFSFKSIKKYMEKKRLQDQDTDFSSAIENFVSVVLKGKLDRSTPKKKWTFFAKITCFFLNIDSDIEQPLFSERFTADQN